MAETHHVEDCTFIADEGCYPTQADIQQLIGRAYPFQGKTVVIRGKCFRVGGAPGRYTLTESRDN